jgi:iron complex outermembrane receptor protein
MITSALTQQQLTTFQWKIFAACIIIGVAPSLASAQSNFAQEPTLEDLLRTKLKHVPRSVEVSTATRVSLSAERSPSTTYVVTSQDIKLYGLRSLGDILSTMPGLYLTRDGYFSYIGIRGLGRSGDFNSRLLFLIDGTRANENISDAGFLGSDALIDVESIERVEFAPGPGSALYGNNAFFGVVNIITKGVDRLRGITAQVQLDNNRQQKVLLSWAHRADADWEAWLSGSLSDWQEIPLPYPVADEFLPYRSQLQNFEQENFHRLQAGLKFSGWTLQGALHRRERSSPEPLGTMDHLTLVKKTNISENHLLKASYRHEFNDAWEMQTSLSSVSNDYYSNHPFIDIRVPLTRNNNTAFINTLQRQILGHWQHVDLKLANRSFSSHLLMSGIEYQKDHTQEINFGLINQPFFQSFYGINERKGIFLQDLWQLNTEHSLILGVRYDKSRIAKENLHPRLGWIWQQDENSTVKLMYGSAFRAANLQEFSHNSPFERPAPSPEQIKTTELSYEKFLTPTSNYKVTLFQSKLSDLIGLDFVGGYYVNEAPLQSRGIEVAFEQRFKQGQQIKANGSWQQSRQRADLRPENSPSQLFNLHYNQPLTPSLQFGWQLQAMSHRDMPQLRLPGYVLTHSHLLWQSSAEIEVALSLYNLTGTEYYDQPTVYDYPMKQHGRTVKLTLEWRFKP